MTYRRSLSRRKWLHSVGLLTLVGCAGQTKEDPIWVGQIGPVGKRNESAINGIQQTLADLIEDETTVAGRRIGVRHVECKDKTRARAEASRLLAVNRVACLIVGPGVEGVADVVSMARSHGAFVVVLDGTADRSLADQAVWLGIDPETSGEMLARYAIAKGQKAYNSTQGIEGEVARGFDREFQRRGGKSLGTIIDPTQPISERIILDVASDGDRKGRLPSITLVGAFGRPEVGISESVREVWKLVLQPDPASLPAEGRTWAERYEKRFGARPDDDAILAADAIALIADGLREIAGDDRRKLVEELMGRSEIAGLTGPITRKDGRTIRPAWVERTAKGVRVGAEVVPQ